MMLDFLWHLRGSVPLRPATSDEAVLAGLDRLLERQRKPVSEGGSDFIAFDAPLWANLVGPNWLALVIYDRGRFWIENGPGRRRLRYDLRSLHGMVFCLLAATGAFLVGFAGNGLPGGLRFAAAAFGWLYGMNLVSALVRVRGTIHKVVRES